MKKLILYLFLISNILFSCQNKAMQKYDWLPTSSAPKLYPTAIYNGHLYLEDGNQVYIPTAAANNPGWGYSGSLHSQGDDLKAIPVKLEITWASFKENKFYTGSWDLPVEKIKQLFEKGTIDWRTNKPSNYNQVVVGCAPGGVVVVWLYGDDQQIEISRFQAKETHIDMKDFSPYAQVPQNEYFKTLGELTPDLEKEFEKKGLQYDIWETYRKKYTWKTSIEIPNHTLQNVNIEMFNGDEETLFNESVKQNPFKKRAIPRLISYIFDDKNGKQTVFEIKYFDEKEIFSLVKKFDENQPIEIVLKMDENLGNKRLVMKQGNSELPIQKIDFDNMWEYKKYKSK